MANEWIKKIFGDKETMTAAELSEAITNEGLKLADLSSGEYVSKRKYDDDILAKDTQISDLNGTIAKRDSDLKDIKAQLSNAGDDKTALEKLTGDLSALQKQYKDDTKAYQDKLTKQAYEFAVREYAGSKQFSSNAAKRDFIQSMIEKNLQFENDKIIGADDFVTMYSQDNADAFVVEAPKTPEPTPDPTPHFVAPTGDPEGSAGTNGGADGFNFNFMGIRAH